MPRARTPVAPIVKMAVCWLSGNRYRQISGPAQASGATISSEINTGERKKNVAMAPAQASIRIDSRAAPAPIPKALIWAMAPGFAGVEGKFALAVELSRITFPYMPLICLTALFSAVLNGLDRFAAAAAAALRRELTLPELAQTLVLTRTPGRASAVPPRETLAAYAATGATLLVDGEPGLF